MTEHIQSDQKCPHCHHPGSQHFTTTDEIGYWGFCTWEECSCFIDERKDEPGSSGR